MENLNLPKNKSLNEWSIMLSYRGSISHGTYVPSEDPNSLDDIDLISIVIPPIDHYMGLQEFGSRGTEEIKEGVLDIVVYEIRKLISMIANGNPNVASLLWLNDEHYIKMNDTGKTLIENRDKFMSQRLYHSFTGYAYGQLKALQKNTFKGYMGEKRKALVEKIGYDSKNASHLIRLLRMGKEIMKTNKIIVYRPDAEELIDIKKGKWTLEQVKDEAEKLFSETDDAFNNTSLPKDVDWDFINDLCCSIVQKHFNIKKHN